MLNNKAPIILDVQKNTALRVGVILQFWTQFLTTEYQGYPLKCTTANI